MRLQSSGAEGEGSRIPHPILPVRSPCYYGVTFHRTRNPSRSIHEYNDLRCSRFFLSLSLFLFFHRIVAIRRREYLFFVGGTRRTLGDVRCSPYSLGCSFPGKKYNRWPSLLSRNNGYSSTLSISFYHCFIARFQCPLRARDASPTPI